ncbi:MAG: PQQ-dependent sugar dehydrogenase [Pseudomonadota bacterium]
MTARLIAFPVLAGFALAACSDDSSPAPNGPVTITSAATATVSENTTGPVYTVALSGASLSNATLALTGPDAADFDLHAASGEISFVTAPDFELPVDADTDNIYEFTITATRGGDSAMLDVDITVADVSDALQARRVGTGFSGPLFLAGKNDGTGRVLVVQKGGRIRILDPDTGTIDPDPFLDLSGTISTASEQGLLGLAFAPDFATSGTLYIYVNAANTDSEIRGYQISASDPDTVDLTTEDVIMRFAQTAGNHNGGWIGFGPDGFLYIASGDGGGNTADARDISNKLGTILRIDVTGDDFPGDDAADYAIPADNPYATGGGDPAIWAWGLRNPYRASFDDATGDLYIGDVGQNRVEEIDVIPSGVGDVDFGWDRFEGTLAFNDTGGPATTSPVLEYDHGTDPDEGNSVTGGVVVRGDGPEGLQGLYFFGDFVRGNIWTVPVADLTPGSTLFGTNLTNRNAELTPDVGAIDNPSAFGRDDDGGVYIVDFDGDIFRIENAP